MVLRLFAIGLLFTWMFVDSMIVFGRRGRQARSAERLSLFVIILTSWAGTWLGILVSFAFSGVPRSLVVPMQATGFLIMVTGIVVRSTAIAQLGRFHMPSVTIQEGHRVIDTGLYRSIRHPSYLGASIAYLGFGLALGSLVSAVIVTATTMAGYVYRMKVEERALLEALGAEYADYRRRTCRLIPGIY